MEAYLSIMFYDYQVQSHFAIKHLWLTINSRTNIWVLENFIQGDLFAILSDSVRLFNMCIQLDIFIYIQETLEWCWCNKIAKCNV